MNETGASFDAPTAGLRAETGIVALGTGTVPRVSERPFQVTCNITARGMRDPIERPDGKR